MHRRDRRGGCVRGEVRARGRRGESHGCPQLVLRLRGDGHAPHAPESHLGLQRHGAPRRSVPRGGDGGARQQTPARLQHLRTGCAGRRRLQHPARCRRTNRAVCAGGACRRHDAGQNLCVDGQCLDGHRRLAGRSRLPATLLGHAHDDRRYGGVRAADGARDLRPRRVRTRLPMGQTPLHRRQGLQPARQATYPRTEGAHLAAEHPDGAHRPRPDGGQPQAGRDGLRGRGAGLQRHCGRLSGATAVDGSLAQRRLYGGNPLFQLRLERYPPAVHSWRRRTTT
jgi:hypothetical protein